jgi:hypothetical protein
MERTDGQTGCGQASLNGRGAASEKLERNQDAILVTEMAIKLLQLNADPSIRRLSTLPILQGPCGIIPENMANQLRR